MFVVSMDTTCMINTLQSLKLEHNLELPVSLLAIQVGLRLCHSGLGYLLRKNVDDNHYSTKLKRLTIGLSSTEKYHVKLSCVLAQIISTYP